MPLPEKPARSSSEREGAGHRPARTAADSPPRCSRIGSGNGEGRVNRSDPAIAAAAAWIAAFKGNRRSCDVSLNGDSLALQSNVARRLADCCGAGIHPAARVRVGSKPASGNVRAVGSRRARAVITAAGER